MSTAYFRSLIRMGKGGLVISVPRPWVRYYELKAGDRLEVIANGELRIRPGRERRVIHRK